MSMETSIPSNPNNELSHRMSRNSQRQSTIARKSRESREAADISNELQLQIDASTVTKTLKAQLKVAKGTSGKRKKKSDETPVILSASPSGRVKTARRREEPSITVRATQSDNPSSATGSPATATQSAEPSIPELYSAQLAPNYFLNEFDFGSLMCSLEGADTSSSAHGLASAELSAFDPAFDPTLFDLSAEWNALMPFSAPPEDPLQDFMNLYHWGCQTPRISRTRVVNSMVHYLRA